MTSDYNPELWTVSSNEALTLNIADSTGHTAFHPTFTYPIFGDSEQIFGYKGLSIHLAFDSSTFLPFLKVKFDKKLNDDVEDVQAKLLEFLPESTILDDEEKWVATFKEEHKTLNYSKFELINKYESKGQEYAIYKTKLNNDLAVELNRRLQILVLLFIEAGSYIDDTDDKWDLFLCVQSGTNNIVGFTTAYSYLKYNGADEFDAVDQLKHRNKISQFVILPTYQSQSHGSQLYNTVTGYWIADENVQEITVEDPNEKFDDLRYRNDFKRLFEEGYIPSLPKNVMTVTNQWYKEQAAKYKIELNQFKKLTEIGYLYNQNVKVARLLIKKRLYEKNRDGLVELEPAVRNDKLQTAFESIQQEYLRIIDTLRLRDSSNRPVKKQKV
ncbi:CYFA0S17e00628g1_1 [Cyberlindnera fabianii]|uniref:Histone acetyltransferase type B catalytic subunit n=1 Tax=Cyberlindnera fabianii TaxID=36022 RepID=A0A061B5Z3_CYBFA|nr:Histone acetyltransferase type B catalytic subunit [Cyberlindnera fabianii]CDR45247.1 CYFA0S17e00628g1_1 [Cyberlindnera fabianii]